MTSVSSSMRFWAYLSVKSTSFCLENLLSVDGLTYSSHSSSRKSSQLRLMYPGSVVQTWRCERSTYRMTFSTFWKLESPHLSANSSYSSRKSWIGNSTSPVKCGASLDRTDGMAAVPRTGAYVMVDVGGRLSGSREYPDGRGCREGAEGVRTRTRHGGKSRSSSEEDMSWSVKSERSR